MPQGMQPVSRIAALRERAELTQRELALLIGVTENTIQNWEKGRAGIEQIVRIIKLCRFLHCDLEDLIDFTPATDEAPAPKTKEHFLAQIREPCDRSTSTNTSETNTSSQKQLNE